MFRLLLVSLLAAGIQAQPPMGEWLSGTSRILIADNTPGNCSIVAVDLPAFNVTHRVSVPGTVQAIGLSANDEYAGVFRARAGNDQHFLTFMHTGLKTMAGIAAPTAPPTVPGYMRRMVTAKTVIVYNGTDTTGGVELGATLVYHPRWETNLMYSEAHGLILSYNATAAANPAQATNLTIKATIPPGHFHLTPVNDFLAAPHTTNSLALLLDSSGKIAFSAECGACHGSEEHEVSQTQSVALFGCNTTVLAVNINTAGKEPQFTNMSLPAVPRIGSFLAAAPGVFWTASQPPVNITAPEQTTGEAFFYRTDVRSSKYAITKVNHPGSTLGVGGYILRALGLPKEQRMFAIHRVGLLVMYNGVTGAALGNVSIQSGGYPLDAPAPFLTSSSDNKLYISVPHTGLVHEVEVNLATGSMVVKRQVAVGGLPGTLVIAKQASL